MTDKYYTPKIEEFHVGFEFESNYISYSKDGEWTKAVLKEDLNNEDIAWFYTSYVGDAVPTEFRVKHLDREDIESLGFKDDVGAGIFFRKRIHTDEEIHLNFDDTILIERCCVMDEDPIEVVFKGKIKNKSVLKQVLKMIGV